MAPPSQMNNEEKIVPNPPVAYKLAYDLAATNRDVR
jgi:hypothetical protein